MFLFVLSFQHFWTALLSFHNVVILSPVGKYLTPRNECESHLNACRGLVQLCRLLQALKTVCNFTDCRISICGIEPIESIADLISSIVSKFCKCAYTSKFLLYIYIGSCNEIFFIDPNLQFNFLMVRI